MNENQALLHRLKTKYGLLTKYDSWSEPYYDFKDELTRVTAKHGDNFEYQEAYSLCQHWLNFAKYVLEDKEGDVGSLDLALFLRYISHHYLVHSIVHEHNHARTLAALCTAQVASELENTKQSRLNVVEPVLAVWLNQEALTSPLTMHEIVTLLYGEGVWALYRPDVADDITFPQHLYDLNMPLQGPLKQIPKNEQTHDMSLLQDIVGLS